MSDAAQIRRAVPADRAALGGLWGELMDFHRGLDPNTFALADDALSRWLEWLDMLMADENRVVLVAAAGADIVGYVHGTVDERPPVYRQRRHGTICEICVTEGWRRRGVGSRLVAALFDWFRERGLTAVHVGAAACNPVSNAFWRHMGFEPYTVLMQRSSEPPLPERSTHSEPFGADLCP